jgi:cobalt-zinc-cadmium resistance protein CzcA
LERDYQQTVLNSEQKNLNAAVQQTLQNLDKDKELLEYYETQGLAQATAILNAAQLSYRSGEISFAELSQFMTQAIDIRKNYLDILNQFNQSAIAYAYYNKP